MFEQLVKMPHVIKRLQKSKFKDILDKYASYLIEKHYSKSSITKYRLALEHFICWLESKQFPPIRQITTILINKFINEHIPICQCPTPAPKRSVELLGALRLLLKIQKENGKYMVYSKSISKTDKLINEFDNHLVNICGLAENTRRYHRRHVKVFLNKMFPKNRINFTSLTPINVRNFLYNNIQHYKRRTFGLFVYSIRSFFKFLQLKGDVNKSLIDSLPRIIEWKLTNLPESLNKKEIEKFLEVFDRATDLGKRDYAMVICIIELGLRASEIANLKLDDINWRDRVVYLPRGKTRQSYVLPITKLMIDSIIDYLKYGRPKTTSRQVFVYHRAPVGQGIIPKVVTEVICRAITRSGLKPASVGSNLLRRTFATNLLLQGTTIKEIADLLRHKSINTTTIYTKVDFHNLTQVALPWLQEAS